MVMAALVEAAAFLTVAEVVEDFAVAGCDFVWVVEVCTGAINMAADKIEIKTGIRIPFRAKRAFNEIWPIVPRFSGPITKRKWHETAMNISDSARKLIDCKANSCVQGNPMKIVRLKILILA